MPRHYATDQPEPPINAQMTAALNNSPEKAVAASHNRGAASDSIVELALLKRRERYPLSENKFLSET